jgi:hypothetical protein
MCEHSGFVVGPHLAVTCVHAMDECGAELGERVCLAFKVGGGSAGVAFLCLVALSTD